jgi:hypothetical protein
VTKPSVGDRLPLHSIVYLDETRRDDLVEILQQASGVILRRGGLLSHVATVTRELHIPTVVASLPENWLRKPILLVGQTGAIRTLNASADSRVKRWMFEAQRFRALYGHRGYHFMRVFEGVVFDPEAVDKLARSISSWSRPTFSGIQTILPFDNRARRGGTVTVRVQSTGKASRLQLKDSQLLFDSPFRRDDEALVDILSIVEGRNWLSSLGFVEFETQERQIEVYEVGDCRIQFNLWPAMSHSYVGIEAQVKEAVPSLLRRANVSPRTLEATDGVRIFRRFGLRLDSCRFIHDPVVESVKRGD